MKINIKPLQQLEPRDCAITCLRMILEFYGTPFSSAQIYDFLLKTADGSSYNTEIARFAQAKGYQVDCWAYHLYITDPSDAQLPKKDLITKLKTQLTHPWFDKELTLLVEATIQAIEDGVNYLIQKPDMATIQSYLRSGTPLIASVNYAALHQRQGNIFEGHDILLMGMAQNKIFYIDPENGQEETVLADDLIFAIASRRSMATSSYLVAINKR